MKNHSALFTVLLISLFLGAAIPKSPATALKDIRKRYHDIETFQASFKETFQWKLTGETTEREGMIYIAGENRFRIETPEQQMVSDGIALYRFNRPRSQVMVESVGKTDAPLPRRILLDFAEEFDAVSLSPLAVDGGEGYRLDLKPKDPEKALLGSASLWVSSNNLLVKRILLIDLNGNTTTYNLHNITFNQPVDSAALRFEPPQGAELFDLR